MKKKFSLFTILALATVTLAGCEKTTNLTSDEIDKLLEEVVSKSVDVNSTTSQQVYYDDESGSSQTQDMTGKLYDNNIYFNEGTLVDEGSGQSAKIFEAQFVSGDKMYYIYDFGGYASESYKKTMDKPATDEEVRNSMVIVTEELLDGLVFDLFTDSATITGTKKGSKETVTLKEEYVASPSSNEYDRNVLATINFEKGSIRKIEYSYSFYEGEILSHTLSGFNTFAVEKVGNYDPSTLPLPDSYYEWVDKTIVEPLELPESTLTSAQINAYVSMASDIVESKATSSVYKYDADSETFGMNEHVEETTVIYGSGETSVMDIQSKTTKFGAVENVHVQYLIQDGQIYAMFDFEDDAEDYKLTAPYSGGSFMINNTAQNGEPWFSYIYTTYKDMVERYNESGYKTEQGGTVIKFSGAINQVDNTVGVRIDITLELDANNNVTKMAIDFTSLYNQMVVATEFVSYTYGYEDNGEFTGERLNPADFPTYNG